jgi:lysophospholipase L1-like esterase
MSLKSLLFALIPTVVVLSVAEIGVRALNLVSDTYRSGGSLGWTARPNLHDYLLRAPTKAPSWTPLWFRRAERAEFSVTTNADGLRTPYGRERSPGAHRVMIFGESTIFGWGLSYDETPAALLEAALGEGWQVVNAGQPGYTSEQVWRLAELAIPAYRPDTVVVFNTWNDQRLAVISDRELLPDHEAVARSKWWAKSHLLRWLVGLEEGAAEGDRPVSPGSPIFSFREALEGEQPRVTSAQRGENIESIASACEEGEAQLVLATLPPAARGITGRDLCPQHPMCADSERLAQSFGTQFFDLTPALRGARDEEVLLYSDPGHFTAVGNELMMRFFAPSLAHYAMRD